MSGRLTEPVRTCIGCRERAQRRDLVRIVASRGSSDQLIRVVPDSGETLPGRGAHLHPDVQCLDQAKRRRAFGRALRVEGALDLSLVEKLAETWPTTDPVEATDETGSPRS